MGDGLQGEYYNGRDFTTRVLTRRDATINFDWHHENPVTGVSPEDFSVRWTGWLVPPASGRYVLHLTVDDGMRVWLDGRQLLNEWRGQSLSSYTVPVELKAGQAYALRIDYCQYAWSTRALLAWERPDQLTPASWRNLWGAIEDDAPTDPIPTRYLYSRNPTPPAPKVVAQVLASAPTLVSKPASATRQPRPQRRPTLPRVARRDTAQATAVAAQLAAGKAVTLRALYFEQGKAYLPAPVQATLDTLATALSRYPALRLEVQGHTDNQGDSTLNYQLSQRRAEAVCHYLAAHGVAADRLRPVGYGGRQPVADNNQPGLRPRNRRVVLQPLAIK